MPYVLSEGASHSLRCTQQGRGRSLGSRRILPCCRPCLQDDEEADGPGAHGSLTQPSVDFGGSLEMPLSPLIRSV